jgi:hypothetical protein
MYETYTANSPESQQLLQQWTSKNEELKAIKKEMSQIRKEISKLAKFKVGEVIKDVETGKEHVIRFVNVDEFFLSSSNPEINFRYETHPIKKDGTVSKNFSNIHDYDNIVSTGRFINI